MKKFEIKEFLNMENPNSGDRLRLEILNDAQNAVELGGLFIIVPPGKQLAYHYHNKRESIFVPISGEAILVLEGKEIPMNVNDVFYVLPKEKHMIINRSNHEFRFLEFFTHPPVTTDYVEVK